MSWPKPIWPMLAGVLGAALMLLTSVAGQELPKTIPLAARLLLVKPGR